MMKLSSYEGHGGQIDTMLRNFPNAPLPWIDLSTGINPFPFSLPPIAIEAWARLPTKSAREACESAMAAAFGCDPAFCRAVPGTELAIRQLAILIGGQSAVCRKRSYADHAESWGLAGAKVISCDDPLDAAGISDVVVIVNPNNPDGKSWTIDEMELARSALAKRGGWLIVDEAFADLDPSKSMASKAGADALIVLRSFGKFFGLAGVRLGAVLAPKAILTGLGSRFGVWDVSGPALKIGVAAYSDIVWQNETRARLRDAATQLSQLLSRAGIKDVGGTDLFRFVKVPEAKMLWQKLANQGIAVRHFSGDNCHLRIGLPTESEHSRLGKALIL